MTVIERETKSEMCSASNVLVILKIILFSFCVDYVIFHCDNALRHLCVIVSIRATVSGSDGGISASKTMAN